MDEEKIPYNSYSADDAPVPVPSVEDAWSMMKRQLDEKMPVRKWYRRIGLWWWVIGVVVIGAGVVVGAHGVGGHGGGVSGGSVRDRGGMSARDSARLAGGGGGVGERAGSAGDSDSAGPAGGSERKLSANGAHGGETAPKVAGESEEEVKAGNDNRGDKSEKSGGEVGMRERNGGVAGMKEKSAGAVEMKEKSGDNSVTAMKDKNGGVAGMSKRGKRGGGNVLGGKHAKWDSGGSRAGRHAVWGNTARGRGKHAVWGNRSKGNGRHANWKDGGYVAESKHANWGDSGDVVGGKHAKWEDGEDAAGGKHAKKGNEDGNLAVEHRRAQGRVRPGAELVKVRAGGPRFVAAADSMLGAIKDRRRAAIAAEVAGKGIANSLAAQYAASDVAKKAKAAAEKKRKDSLRNRSSLSMSAGLSVSQVFPMGREQRVAYNVNGKSNILLDYLPAPYFRFYAGDKFYVQGAVKFNSPQYVRPQAIDSTKWDTTYLVSYGAHQKSELSLNKLYYTNIPVSIHYKVFNGLYLGVGLQYSRLLGAAGEKTISIRPYSGPDSIYSRNIVGLKNDSVGYRKLSPSEWRIFAEADYRWRKWTLGLRYEQALKPYLSTTLNGTKSTERNGAFSVHVYYDLWERKRN